MATTTSGDTDIVQIEVLETKDLFLRDSAGDIVVTVAAPGLKKKLTTSPKPKSPTASFQETLRAAFPRSASNAAILVEVATRDSRGKPEQTVGVVSVGVETLLPFNTSHDAWHPLAAAKQGDAVKGSIHLRLLRFPPRSKNSLALPRGAKPDVLFEAIDSGDLYLLVLALEAKFDPNTIDKHHETPLHKACRFYDSEAFAMALLRHPQIQVDTTNMDGNTALHLVAKCFKNPNCEGIVKALIAKGANPNAKNANGETPLHQAVLNPTACMLLVELLAKNGANVNEPTTSRGATPVHYSVQLQKVELVALLLEYGADLERKDTRGQSPLDLCRSFGDLKLLKALEEFKELDEYLTEIGLADVKPKFVQQRLFKYKLRKLEGFDLDLLGIDASRHAEILAHFAKLTDAEPKPMAPSANEIVSGDLESISKAYIIDESEVEFSTLLGEGTAGQVYKGTYRGTDVAIKVMLGASEQEAEEFCKEFNLVSAVRSPNVIPLFGAIIGKKALAGKLCMVMEYMDMGSLYHYMSNPEVRIGWKESLSIMNQTVNGLLALHSHNPPIMHRDLKSLNLLVTSQLRVKLCDFGLSRFNTSDNLQTLQRIRGTYAYVAPEILHKKPYTDKSDVYSLAVIFWEIVNKCITRKYQAPYDEYRDSIRMDYIILTKAANQDLRPTIPPTTPTALRNIISMCWNPKQESRPSCVALQSLLDEVNVSYYKDKERFDACIV